MEKNEVKREGEVVSVPRWLLENTKSWAPLCFEELLIHGQARASLVGKGRARTDPSH